jgi:hypothetical protein
MAMNISRTKEWRRTAGGFLLLFAGLLLSGCTVAHMELPQGLESESTALDVDGLGFSFITNKMSFGPYRVTNAHQGWTKTTGWSIGGFGSSKAKRKYRFSITGPDRGTWDALCVTGARWKRVDLERFLSVPVIVEFSSTQQVICDLKQQGGGKESKLYLSRSLRAGQPELQGAMVDGDTQIEVFTTHKLDATPMRVGDPTGYIFRIGGRSVGAVEVINQGTVWMNNSVKPEVRSALAATSVIMLLYKDIQK